MLNAINNSNNWQQFEQYLGNPEQIKSGYFAIDENRIENLRGHRTNSSAFKWYLEYHSEINN